MATISEMIKRAERLKAHTSQLLENSVNESSREAANLNRSQLDKGMKSDGSFMSDYAPSSVKKGKRSGPIRLYETGAFWDGIFFIADNDKIIVQSDDRKNNILQSKYGENILGLTRESKFALAPFIQRSYVKQAKDILYGR